METEKQIRHYLNFESIDRQYMLWKQRCEDAKEARFYSFKYAVLWICLLFVYSVSIFSFTRTHIKDHYGMITLAIAIVIIFLSIKALYKHSQANKRKYFELLFDFEVVQLKILENVSEAVNHDLGKIFYTYANFLEIKEGSFEPEVLCKLEKIPGKKPEKEKLEDLARLFVSVDKLIQKELNKGTINC